MPNDGFNIETLLLNFYSEEAKITDFFTHEDTVLIKDISDVLNIGYVDFVDYSNKEREKKGLADQQLVYFYEGDTHGEECIIDRHEKTKEGSIVFRVYPRTGCTWSEKERHYVKLFLSILAQSKSRIRLYNNLDYVSYHDMQTDFYNLQFGIRQINMLIQKAVANEFAVFFFNLRNMTEINRIVGNSNGDRLIILYGKEFEKVIRSPEVFWRVGGDNFGAVIYKDHVDEFLSLIRGKNIRFGPNKEDVAFMSACSGVYLIEENVKSHFEVMDAVTSSLSFARYVKHVPYHFFDEDTKRIIDNNRRIEALFEQALKKEEFAVYYQPKVSIKTYDLEGAEALCRWRHDGSLIPPDAFIPVLENTKRICSLDFYMLAHVCADLRKWLDDGLDAVRISVNFSRRHLSNPNFVKDILSIIDMYNLPHNLIVAEFTETTTEADFRRLKDIVFNLREKGIDTSVDDFGVGYSSMSLIRDVPFNELKIDKTFLSSDSKDYERKVIMMKHVISLATDLGMSCIVEGVETKEQVELLKSLSCFRVQGYYFDRPLEKSEYLKRLENHHYDKEDIGV